MTARTVHASLREEEDFFRHGADRPSGSSARSAGMFRASYLPDSLLVRKGKGARTNIEPGCTIAALDYRQSRERSASKGTSGSMRATSTGGRRLMGA